MSQSNKLAPPKLLLRPSALGSSSQDKSPSQLFGSNNKEKSSAQLFRPSNKDVKVNQLFGSNDKSSVPIQLFAKKPPTERVQSKTVVNIFKPAVPQFTAKKDVSTTSSTGVKKASSLGINMPKPGPVSTIPVPSKGVKNSSSHRTNLPKSGPVSNTPSTGVKNSPSLGSSMPKSGPVSNTKNSSALGTDLPKTGPVSNKISTGNQNSSSFGSEMPKSKPVTTTSSASLGTDMPESGPTVGKLPERSKSRKSKAPRKNVVPNSSLPQSSNGASTTPTSSLPTEPKTNVDLSLTSKHHSNVVSTPSSVPLEASQLDLKNKENVQTSDEDQTKVDASSTKIETSSRTSSIPEKSTKNVAYNAKPDLISSNDKIDQLSDDLNKTDSDVIHNLQNRMNKEIVSEKIAVEQKNYLKEITNNEHSILDDSNFTKKRFDCDQCPKSYKHSTNLYTHKKLHTGENSKKSGTVDENSKDNKNVEKKKPGRKATKCGDCKNCKNQKDCGKCKNCLDKPKFGGPSKIRQKCIEKVCLKPKNDFTGTKTSASPQQKLNEPGLNNIMEESSIFPTDNLDESLDLDTSMEAYIDDFQKEDFDDIPLQENLNESELNHIIDNLGESSVLDAFPSKESDESLEIDSSMNSYIDDFLNASSDFLNPSSDLNSDLDSSIDSLLDDVLDDPAEFDASSLNGTFNATLDEVSQTEIPNKTEKQKQKRKRKIINCKNCPNCKRSKDCGKCENCLYKENVKKQGERIKSTKYKCLQKVCLNIKQNQPIKTETPDEDNALEDPNRSTLETDSELKNEDASQNSQLEEFEELFELFLDVVDLSKTDYSMPQNIKIIASYENSQINHLGDLLNMQNEVVFDVDEENYTVKNAKKQNEVIFDVDEGNYTVQI